MSAVNIKARKKARKLALQAIYQWQLTNDELANIQAQFLAHMDNQDADRDYFKLLVNGVMQSADQIDDLYASFLDRDLKDVSPIELAILRLASFELNSCVEIPYKVVLNEAIELTKIFGAVESYRYVNGVLDKVAAKIRINESR